MILHVMPSDGKFAIFWRDRYQLVLTLSHFAGTNHAPTNETNIYPERLTIASSAANAS